MNALDRLLGPMKRRVALMIGRAIVNVVNDATRMQGLQVSLLADEVRDNVERFQNYGFTSHPHPGAEAVAACVNGSRDHVLVIAVDDRRYRLQGLVQGEVAIYTDEGDKLVIKRGGTIEVTASTKVRLVTPLVEMTGNATVAGNLTVAGNSATAGNGTVAGTLTATVDVVGGGKSLKTHTHGGVTTGGGATGAPT